MTTFLFYSVVVLFVLSAILLLGLVMLQVGRTAHSLFGGPSGLLGGKTPQALTWVTAGAFTLFLALAVTLNLMA